MQRDQCDFCLRPRDYEIGGRTEYFYLVEVSGPYSENFDEDSTAARSKNRKNLWGCRDCVNLVQDTDYWMKFDEGIKLRPYYNLFDINNAGGKVLPLSGRHKGLTPEKAVEKYPPVKFFAKPGRLEQSG
jgi:hypothetical protein